MVTNIEFKTYNLSSSIGKTGVIPAGLPGVDWQFIIAFINVIA